jgi:hypothetical protein
MITTEDGNRVLVVSFLWEEYTQVDVLYNIGLDFKGVSWVTCRSLAAALTTILGANANTDLSSITMESVEPPHWASDYQPLISRKQSEEGALFEGGMVQKFSSVLADHHMITVNTLTSEERDVLLRTALVELGSIRMHIASLLTVGALNPFNSVEDLSVVPTEKGAMVAGQQVIVSHL